MHGFDHEEVQRQALPLVRGYLDVLAGNAAKWWPLLIYT